MASVHPAFHITMTELAELTRGLPETIQARIQKDPFRFFQLVEQVMAEPPELLWLVDKQHALPSEYEPDDLVPLVNYQDRLVLNRNDLSLRQLILPDLFDMVTAAEADDVTLDLSSTYRSYEYQAGLFQRNVEQLGLEQAERESARPGTSQHQLGTTIDFGSITPAFAETTAGKWLAREAWRFGFSMSYPEGYEELTGYMYESWHFRYIGVAAANLEQEFFGGIQQHLLEFWHNKRETLREMSS